MCASFIKTQRVKVTMLYIHILIRSVIFLISIEPVLPIYFRNKSTSFKKMEEISLQDNSIQIKRIPKFRMHCGQFLNTPIFFYQNL